MGYCRAVWYSLFFAVLACQAQTPGDVVQKPVSERQLLCWIVGGLPQFNVQYELQTRGVDFVLDATWLEHLRLTGTDADLLSAVQKAQPVSGASAPMDEFSDRLLRIIKESNTRKFAAAQLHLMGLAKLDKSSPDFLFARGAFLNRQENWEEAIPVLLEAIQVAPGSAYAHEQLSFAYYRMDIPDQSIKEAKAALAIRPSDPDAHKFLGLAHLSMHEFSDADREFNEALKLKPDYAVAYGDLALSAAMQGQNVAAIKLYMRAELLDPRNAHFPYGAGISYTRLNRVDEAIAAYKQAKNLAPDDLRIRQNLGAAYCNSGRNEEAVAEFQDLLTIDPDWNMARLCLYKSLNGLGRVDEAAAVKAEYDRREAGGTD